ncbi:MAG: hypothetical protein M3O02_04580 [Acidobacteriota bacterium]|nr:hypothetical protein [Acidobacteriota bacterium]
MTHAQMLLEDFDTEMASTRRMLERIPEENPDWKPHEKSFAIGKLAMHVATLPAFVQYIMEDPGMDLANSTRARADMTFQTRASMLATFDAYVYAARKALASASDEHLAAAWPFRFGEHRISADTRSKTYRVMFFNHLVHHRAQLAVYLRLNEIPVPGMYGPSADEPFKA